MSRRVSPHSLDPGDAGGHLVDQALHSEARQAQVVGDDGGLGCAVGYGRSPPNSSPPRRAGRAPRRAGGPARPVARRTSPGSRRARARRHWCRRYRRSGSPRPILDRLVAYHPEGPSTHRRHAWRGMRRVFLWAARNPWLKERLPASRSCVEPSAGSCPARRSMTRLAAACALADRRHRDALHAPRREPRGPRPQADAVAAHYTNVSTASTRPGIDGEISVKPTQLGLDLDADACLAHLERLAEHAAATGSTSGSTWRAAHTPRPRSRSTSG